MLILQCTVRVSNIKLGMRYAAVLGLVCYVVGISLAQHESLRAILTSDEFFDGAGIPIYYETRRQKDRVSENVKYPFQNTTLSFGERVDDLVSGALLGWKICRLYQHAVLSVHEVFFIAL